MLELNAGHRYGAILQAFRVRVSRDRCFENDHVILQRASMRCPTIFSALTARSFPAGLPITSNASKIRSRFSFPNSSLFPARTTQGEVEITAPYPLLSIATIKKDSYSTRKDTETSFPTFYRSIRFHFPICALVRIDWVRIVSDLRIGNKSNLCHVI